MSSDPISTAPWSEGEVAALNAWQRSGAVYPFTCGADHNRHQTMVAERDGWHCPDSDCSYTQDWAMASMTDLEALHRLQMNRLTIWGGGAYRMSGDPLADRLKQREHDLRATEDQLAEARAQIATLSQQNRALRIVLARVTQAQRVGLSPSVPDMAGECDASWVLTDSTRPIEDNYLPENEDLDNCD